MQEKLKLKERIAYSMGDVSANLLATFISSFAIWFYTEIDGINAMAVGTMCLIANIWDAINDPMMGFIVDHGKVTKHGTYKPWIRRAAIPIAVFFVLQFTVPSLGMTGKLIWVYVTYIGTDMLFTVINVPYGVLNNLMTSDIDERTVLSTFRNIGSNVGSLIVTYGTVPLVAFFGAGNDAKGYQRTAILFAVISTVALYILFYGVKERLEPAKPDLKIKETYKSIFHNKPAICLVIAMFIFNTTVNFKFAYNIYYCSIYMGRKDLVSAIGSISFLVAMASLVLVPKMTEKLEKKGMLLLGGLMYIATGIVFILGGHSVTILYVTAVMFGFCLTFSFTILWGAIPDAVEYGEWKTGIRAPGSVYSACTFANKLAQGVSGWLVGVTLTVSGYVAGSVTQTVHATQGIFWSNALVLIAGGLLGAAAMLPYNLNKKTFNKILKEIEDRKNNK